MRSLVPEDIYSINVVNDLELSPDGRSVAYVLGTFDRAGDVELSAIWVVDVASGTARQVTSGQTRESSPHWSPDGKSLAYTRISSEEDSNSGRAIYLVDTNTWGKHTSVIKGGYGVEQYTWSPDSQRICFVSKQPATDPISSATRSYRVMKYVDYADGWFDGRYKNLWIVELETGRITRLTDFDTNDSDPAFSPDGQEIAFTSNRTTGRDFNSTTDIWIVDASVPRRIRQVTDSVGVARKPSYSPDGSSIAYLGHRDHPGNEGVNVHVYVVSVQGGEVNDVLAGWDRPAWNLILTETRTHAPQTSPVWSPDGSTIYFVGTDRAVADVYQIKIGESKPERMTAGDHEVWKVSFDRSRTTFAAFLTDPCNAGDVYVAGGDSALRRLTSINGQYFDDVALAPIERIQVPGADGSSFEALLQKPAGFDASKRYPLVVRIPGGPHLCYGFSFVDEVQMLVGSGHVVASLNPRGTQSYGQERSVAVIGDWAGKDAEDITAAVDYLGTLPYVDRQRIGVTGASYGGYMVNWLVGHSNQFAAAVSQRSISNAMSLLGTCDFVNGDFLLLAFGGQLPYDKPDKYLERSPVMYARRVETPLLLIQGGFDFLTPLTQAQEFYAALKLLGKTVQLTMYPDEMHYIRRYGTPSTRIHYTKTHLDWFKEYLLEQATPRAITGTA